MTGSRFVPHNNADITRLITRCPLAWIISDASRDHATPLPLRPERIENDLPATLTGHYARANPQAAVLRETPRATLLFMGPNGYVSPSWMSDRTQAPTWNYACVNIDVRMEFLDNHADLDRIVRDLVDAMENGRPNHWRVEEMHARYEKLLSYIIPFRAHVLTIHAKFKLGQDEPDTTYPEIIRGLHENGDQALIDMMSEANPGRAD